jgi:hypothetical protein
MKETVGEALKSGAIGGILGGGISGMLNYCLLPFPQDMLDNAIGHGISGFFCGFVAGAIGILMYVRFHGRSVNQGSAGPGPGRMEA